jgi:hypothetical protein
VVTPQRRVSFAVGKAKALLVDDFAPAQHGPGDTGQEFLIDVALHGRSYGGKIMSSGVHLSLPGSRGRDISTNMFASSLTIWTAASISHAVIDFVSHEVYFCLN